MSKADDNKAEDVAEKLATLNKEKLQEIFFGMKGHEKGEYVTFNTLEELLRKLVE